MKVLLVPALAAALPLLSAATNPPRDPERLNVLVITADDMSCDSVGVYAERKCCQNDQVRPSITKMPTGCAIAARKAS